jgi:uncharacterized protein YdiU (UPF0061 family)
LWRGDEPSPTRSAVLVRLSHGHIRIGTFQRLLALERADEMAQLVDYCLAQYPGPPPPDNAPGRDQPAVILLHQVVDRMADLAAAYMAAGFVHGVLNTDNMNISGESFDYGPWRWLPTWDAGFTAAYFDHQGLYSFGRQPEAMRWNCGQFAVALRLLVEAPPLIAALERFEPRFEHHLARRVLWRLGVQPQGGQADTAVLNAIGVHLRESGVSPDAFYFAHHHLRALPDGPLGEVLAGYRAVPGGDHPLWDEPGPPTLVIEEVERIWAAIDSADDWAPLHEHVAAIRRLGDALGPAPAAV